MPPVDWESTSLMGLKPRGFFAKDLDQRFDAKMAMIRRLPSHWLPESADLAASTHSEVSM